MHILMQRAGQRLPRRKDDWELILKLHLFIYLFFAHAEQFVKENGK